MGVLLCNSENATSNYLAHHGVLGMSWGKKNGPPYPLNASGKAALRKQKRDARALKKLQRQQRKQQKREIEEERRQELNRTLDEKRKAKMQRDKERIMRSASANELAKYKGLWTNDELRYIAERLRLEQNISSYQKEITPKLDQLDRLTKKVERVATYGERGIKAWNVFAKLVNAVRDSEGKEGKEGHLPVIGEKKNKDKENKNKDNNN